jgi:hypothetical protein
MKIIYDFIFKILFLTGYFKRVLKTDKNYEFIYDDITKQNILNALKNNNLLIASNHMTLIDSSLIQLCILEIVGGTLGVLKNNFRPLLWNLPAVENIKLLKSQPGSKSKLFYKYFRVLPINRNDADESAKTLKEASNLISKGNIFVIFPEAGRTRRDQFNEDDMTPGAAKILLDCEKECGKLPGLLTIYIRAEDQVGHSNLPSSNKIKIYAEYNEDFQITKEQSALRKRKNITIFIGKSISRLQEKFHKMN